MRKTNTPNVSLRRLVAKTESRNWLFLGDSITMGARHTHGWRDYTQLFAERVRHELRRHHDLVLNAGVDGCTASGCLAGLGGVLASFKPDVALLMIGTNDAAADRRITPGKFKNALRAIVAKLRAAGARIILQTPNPIIPELAAPYRRAFGGMVRAMRETAVAEELPLIDHNAYWAEHFPKAGQTPLASYLCDGIHPNAFGHALLAHHLFVALGIDDAAAPSGRSFVPQPFTLPQLQRQTHKK